MVLTSVIKAAIMSRFRRNFISICSGLVTAKRTHYFSRGLILYGLLSLAMGIGPAPKPHAPFQDVDEDYGITFSGCVIISLREVSWSGNELVGLFDGWWLWVFGVDTLCSGCMLALLEGFSLSFSCVEQQTSVDVDGFCNYLTQVVDYTLENRPVRMKERSYFSLGSTEMALWLALCLELTIPDNLQNWVLGGFVTARKINFYSSGYTSSLQRSITVSTSTEIAGTFAEAVNAWKKLVLLRMSTDI
ncbi:hypothetical protein Tco_0893368 [Tanacetum coccineum]|uniref:Uncharacterized protein n=1 Tax=Tanacetum coccineum TaxID=301880 RepID=A0ABQ5CBU0_9ASTR